MKRKRDSSSIDCPVCGSTALVKEPSGVKCLKCHTFYSTRQLGIIRKMEFKTLVARHFNTPGERDAHDGEHDAAHSHSRDDAHASSRKETRESIVFTVRDDDGRIEAAIFGLQDSVRKAKSQLEMIDSRKEHPVRERISLSPVEPVTKITKTIRSTIPKTIQKTALSTKSGPGPKKKPAKISAELRSAQKGSTQIKSTRKISKPRKHGSGSHGSGSHSRPSKRRK